MSFTNALLAVCSFFFLSLSANAQVSEKQRIVSMSLCTDQMLLMLTEPENIAAITFLSKDPVYSYHIDKTKGLVTHTGLAEEIVPLNPDIIITSKFSSGNAVSMLKKMNYQVESFASPSNLEEVESFTRAIAKAIGAQRRAEKVLEEMHADIAKAKAIAAQLPRETAISYAPNGYTAGTYTLKTDILNAAGYDNLASLMGIDYYGNVSIESLLVAKPDVVIIDEDLPNQDSLAQRLTSHPALSRILGDKGPTRMPTNHWLCPGPLAAKAILYLAEQRL